MVEIEEMMMVTDEKVEAAVAVAEIETGTCFYAILSQKLIREGVKNKKKKILEFSRFSGWVGLKKSIFQIKKKKNMVSKCIKMPKY